MKITMIGAGGVRTPMAIPPILRRAGEMGLTEVCLHDINDEKLRIFSALARDIASQSGRPDLITSTTDAHTALKDADYVITTIRVGGDYGRVLDERIALRHGVLGQETTGAGGFAMALRSIPVILEYAKMLADCNPEAWILNFTNPAGLVTQALHTCGYDRVVGICDSANGAQNAVANWLKLPSQDLRAEVFGLNHLSWARSVTHNGKDVLRPLLSNPQFQIETLLRLFDPALIEHIGMWLNEYLYYWYYSKQALESVSEEALSRGESIMQWNSVLLEQLRAIDIERDTALAREHYDAYMERRIGTYMTYGDSEEEAKQKNELLLAADEEEGYMGVALDVILSLETDHLHYTALNVPNRGAITCMGDDDVVEVSCKVDGSGVQPLPIGDIPEPQEVLMRSVKLYEKLAVQAILAHSRMTAAEALMVHPLIYSFSLAQTLVDDYLEAHAEYVGKWD